MAEYFVWMLTTRSAKPGRSGFKFNFTCILEEANVTHSLEALIPSFRSGSHEPPRQTGMFSWGDGTLPP